MKAEEQEFNEESEKLNRRFQESRKRLKEDKVRVSLSRERSPTVPQSYSATQADFWKKRLAPALLLAWGFMPTSLV